jgi:hypothetical protein
VVTERRGTTILFSLNLSALEQAMAGLYEIVDGARGGRRKR